MKNIAFLLAGIMLSSISFSQTINKLIIIDQFGYLPQATKVAILVDPQVGINSSSDYIPGSRLEVVNTRTGKSVFEGSPEIWHKGNIDPQAGDRGWWFNFSQVQDTGTFYVLDRSNNARSYNFRIANNVYLDALNAACKVFYYNRCNSAKKEPWADKRWTDNVDFMDKNQDSECHDATDPTNPAKVKDLSGGWWDAGDYNKYIQFLYKTIPHMLSAYKQNPEVFSDNINIPESGNGVPDIIDEIVVELLWMCKMQEPDGSVHMIMGVNNWDKTSPPSAQKTQRFYGPVCSSAAIVLCEVFAQSALLLQQFPLYKDLATNLQQRAILSWNWFMNNPKNDKCDNAGIKMGDPNISLPDQEKTATVAAVYLFELTGDTTYNSFLKTNLAKQEPYIPDNSDLYLVAYHTALLDYTSNPAADAGLTKTIIDGHNSNSNKATWVYGWQDTLSLYRSYMSDRSYHWGSIIPLCGTGITNLLAVQNNLNTPRNNQFIDKASGMLHFIHGVNPFNLMYISNMYDFGADNCVNKIYHSWFDYGTPWADSRTGIGPPPGYLTGGPNREFKTEGCCTDWCKNYELCKYNLSPVTNQPVMKMYLDENFAAPINAWQFSEPAIYYQAYYIRLIAPFVRVK